MPSTKDSPKHDPDCAYSHNAQDYCSCGTTHLGKPFTHWQRAAKRLVVEQLLREATKMGIPSEVSSIIHNIAGATFIALAAAESLGILAEVTEQRDRCVDGMNLFLEDITSDES